MDETIGDVLAELTKLRRPFECFLGIGWGFSLGRDGLESWQGEGRKLELNPKEVKLTWK